jgi:putative tryptophan/tyrosine transport system substrate-binding protein
MRRREFIALLGGGTAAWPLTSRAQQPAMPVVGFLNGQSLALWADMVAAFQQGLKEGGFVEGRNVAIEYRWAENIPDKLPALVADLVERHPAVIVTSGGDVSLFAATAATKSIPIVFISGSDPVASGIVASLGHPGGNATGVTMFSEILDLKRLEILHQALPSAANIAIIANPNSPRFGRITGLLERASQTMGLKASVLPVRNEGEFEPAFVALKQLGCDALLAAAEPLFLSRREQLVAIAARYTVPAMYHIRELPVAGGLMSYGSSQPGLYRQMGVLTAKILKGTKPTDLPVEEPAKFEFVINLKTAKALSIDLPPPVLIRADEVIE